MDGETRSRRSVVKHAALQFTNIEKLLSSGKRIVRGVASSANIDRQGDIVVPSGGVWKLPVPLLWQHNHQAPIGWVRSLSVRGDQIQVEAEFAIGIARADEAWQMVEAMLVDSFSIGFRALPGGTEQLPSGGIRFTRWELLECSVVTIPANADAKIQRVSQPNAVKLTTQSNGAVRLTGPSVKLVQLSANEKRVANGIPLTRVRRRADGAIDMDPLPGPDNSGSIKLLSPRLWP